MTRRLLTVLIALAVFSGLLYGTRLLLSGLTNLPSISSVLSSRDGKAVRDIPLRADSNVRSNQLGWVPSGSKVRIVSENDTWFEVDVIEFGREREPDWQTHGWIAKKAKSGDDNVDFSR